MHPGASQIGAFPLSSSPDEELSSATLYGPLLRNQHMETETITTIQVPPILPPIMIPIFAKSLFWSAGVFADLVDDVVGADPVAFPTEEEDSDVVKDDRADAPVAEVALIDV